MKTKISLSIISIMLCLGIITSASGIDFTRYGSIGAGAKLNPLSFFVGRVAWDVGGTSRVNGITVDKYIDINRGRVNSVTDELAWDFNKGFATINTPKSQAATGFLSKAGKIELDDIIIRSNNEYGTVLAVALDDKPLNESENILIQMATDDTPFGYETKDVKTLDNSTGKQIDAKEIISLGQAPFMVTNFDATITFKEKGDLKRILALDENGYPREKMLWRDNGNGFDVTVNPNALYTVVQRGAKGEEPINTERAGSSASVWWEGEDFKTSNYPASTGFSVRTFDPGQESILSNGDWLSSDGEVKEGDEPYYVTYEVDVPKTAKYFFYSRKFWQHGPFNWRFDDQEWSKCERTVALLDRVSIRRNLEVNWVGLGMAELTEGKHILEIKLTGEAGNWVSCFDAFVLTEAPFFPNALERPNQKSDAAVDGKFSFQPDIDVFSNESFIDLSYLNEEEAGMNGPIRREGDKILLGDGTPVRFWGINVRMRSVYNEKEMIDYYVKYLAKLGINLVRLHGEFFTMDFRQEKAELDDEYIDRIQYLIYALKREGIYTKLSYFFPLWNEVDWNWEGQGYNGSYYKNPFGAIFYNESYQEMYRQGVELVMNNVSKYTGLRIADEPAIAMTELINEDNLFFNTWGTQHIPAAQMEMVGKMFAEWVKEKYGSIANAQRAWGPDDSNWFVSRDKIEEGILWPLDSGRLNGRLPAIGTRKRATDYVEFYTQLQVETFEKFSQQLKDLGVKGLISCGNWKTAYSQQLSGLDRYTYRVGDIIDRHGYISPYHTGPAASYQVNVGDIYRDESGMLAPDKLPLQYLQFDDYPFMISEIGWQQPNYYTADMPFMIAAYGSLQGLDAPIMFQSEQLSWDTSRSKFNLLTPSMGAQFPGFGLVFRRGDVTESSNVITETLSLQSLYNLNGTKIYESLNLDAFRQ